MSSVYDPQNAVKLRAQRRARRLGKSLVAVYREAGVNKAYLSDVPKTGWQHERLGAIAAVLGWTVDRLLHGPDDDDDPNALMDLAIAIAVECHLTYEGNADDSAKIGQLARLLLQGLRDISGSSVQLPSRHELLSWGRVLIAALSSTSEKV